MRVEIGDRFYDPEQDMYVTVLEIMNGDTAVIQYDNGQPDSLPTESLVDNHLQLLNTYYSDKPPTLQDACIEGAHAFDEAAVAELLSTDNPDYYPKCGNCNLSTEVLKECLGHGIMPSLETICDVCHERVDSDNCRRDARNRPVCDACWTDFSDLWKMPTDVLETDFAFYHPSCGWFTETIPDSRDCPQCSDGRITLITTDSTTYQSLVEHEN